MNPGNVRLFQNRWKAVEEIERQELRAMPFNEHWQKLNSVLRFARQLGLKRDDDDGETEVYSRWARLKEEK